VSRARGVKSDVVQSGGSSPLVILSEAKNPFRFSPSFQALYLLLNSSLHSE